MYTIFLLREHFPHLIWISCSSFWQTFAPLRVQDPESWMVAAHKLMCIIITVDGMNPNNPPLSRSTINDFLEIPNSLSLNINCKTTYYPTESKNNASLVTTCILMIVNSRLMGNSGAQWRTKVHSETSNQWHHTGTWMTAAYFAVIHWYWSSLQHVKSLGCKVSFICKVKDSKISKRLNTELLHTQLVIKY